MQMIASFDGHHAARAESGSGIADPLIRSDHVLYRQDSGCKLPIGIAIITGSSEALRAMPI